MTDTGSVKMDKTFMNRILTMVYFV